MNVKIKRGEMAWCAECADVSEIKNVTVHGRDLILTCGHIKSAAMARDKRGRFASK